MHKSHLIMLVLFCGLLGACAQVMFKFAARDLTFSFQALLNWKFLVALGAYGIAMVLYLFALRHEDVSQLYPLIASSYVWAAVLAYFLLREQITVPSMVGIGLIVAGISVMAWQVQK